MKRLGLALGDNLNVSFGLSPTGLDRPADQRRFGAACLESIGSMDVIEEAGEGP